MLAPVDPPASTRLGLRARNLLSCIETLVDGEACAIRPDRDDERVRATLLTRDGRIEALCFDGTGKTQRRV